MSLTTTELSRVIEAQQEVKHIMKSHRNGPHLQQTLLLQDMVIIINRLVKEAEEKEEEKKAISARRERDKKTVVQTEVVEVVEIKENCDNCGAPPVLWKFPCRECRGRVAIGYLCIKCSNETAPVCSSCINKGDGDV